MRIISYEDACAGKIPTQQNFHDMRAMVRNVLRQSEHIEAALDLGSVAYGNSEPTSDFDVLVICTDEYFENGKAAEVLAHLSERAHYQHIPLAWIFTPLSIAQFSMKHPWEYSFMKSMEWSGNKNGIIKGDPIRLMGMRDDDTLLYAREYTRRKMSKFRNTIPELLFLSDERRYTILGDVYSFPIHVARKVLQCAGYTFPCGDGKDAVYKEYRERFKRSKSVELFNTLMALREEYVSALSQIMGEVNTLIEREYRRVSQLNTDILLLAHAFGDASLDLLTEIDKSKTAR
ncbi:MAG: hypothetical protein H8D63_03255 [Parcubacteria group bacterium]|nr:hypothetical protein [Parcubacteria group bacterium]